MNASRMQRFGAIVCNDGVRFRLFAPAAHVVALVLDGHRDVPMAAEGGGWFSYVDPNAKHGTRYAFRLDGGANVFPDPASRFQPEGPHGPSEVVDSRVFVWPRTAWHGRPAHEHIYYEIHVGTFTAEGTYAAAAERLDALVDLGITAIELMPLSTFPGKRNWGYDGAFPYAPAAVYGRPEELKAFVAAAHERGLAAILDVVYNHFGPEGNYLHAIAPPFFTERFTTPWGAAIDFDKANRADVRAFFIENARYWIEEFRFDGLRLDATQAIFDRSEPHVLHELHDAVTASIDAERHVTLVVENENNDISLLRAGYDGQWNDDVHHAMHVLATGESYGYYGDFADRPAWLLARALATGYGYQGEASLVRAGVRRGAPSSDLPLSAFVNCLQNHDQIGNRALGERITELAPAAAVDAMTAILLLAPSPPMLFMGQEWGASTPFLFFCDFEPSLAEAVTAGRKREFAASADAAGSATVPDPNAEATFLAARLRFEECDRLVHRTMRERHRALLRLRAAEIVPRAARVCGNDARFRTIGARGIAIDWRMDDGAMLALRANLGPRALDGLDRAAGRTLFATHASTAGPVPPWFVRWSIE